MAKRPYKKRNLEYWNNLSEGRNDKLDSTESLVEKNTDFEPLLLEIPF